MNHRNTHPQHSTLRDATPTTPTWFDDALCAQVDPGLFFPNKGESVADAKRICRACPALTHCRDWAINDPTLTDGIFGATTRNERRAIRRQRRATTTKAAA